MKITVFTTYLTRYEGEMSQIRLECNSEVAKQMGQ